jgi:hypothetical protein
VNYYQAWAAQGGANAPKYVHVDGMGPVNSITEKLLSVLV